MKNIFAMCCTIGTACVPLNLSAAGTEDHGIHLSFFAALTALALLSVLCLAVFLLRRTLIKIFLQSPFSFAILNSKGEISSSKLSANFATQFPGAPGNLSQLPSELTEKFQAAIAAVYLSSKPETVEYEVGAQYYKAEFFRTHSNLLSSRMIGWFSYGINDYKKDEQRYKETSTMLQVILDNVPCAIFAKDIDNGLRYVLSNNTHSELCDIKHEDIIGADDFQLFSHGDTAEQCRRNDLTVLNSPDQFFDGVETVFLSSDRISFYRSIKTIVTEESGRRLLLGISIDITRQQEIERKLSNTNRLLQTIMDNLPCALFVKDPDRDYSYIMANRMFADFVNFKVEDMPGKTDRDLFILPENAAGCRKTDQEAVESGKLLDCKETVMAGDRNFYTLRCIKDTVNYDDGQRYLLGICVDITRQEEAERKLSNTNRLLQTIMDNLPCALFVKDPDRDYSYIMANRMFADFVNFKVEDMPGKTDRDLFILPENAAGCRKTDQEAVESGKLLDCKETVMAGDRNFYTLRCIKDTVNYDDGQRYLLGICVDITRQEEAERELIKALAAAESANKAKNFFLATVSHELRTPLNAVIGFSELLKRGGIEEEETKDCIDSISFAGNALLNLINDVLDLSKIEADQMEIIPKTVNLNDLLQEIRAIFSNRAAEKQLQLIMDVPEKMPPLLLDSLRLRQILLNVVGNALKFTHNGFVKIKAVSTPYENDSTKGELVIEVIDSGIGISKEFQKKLFTPFAQQRTTDDKTNREGTGLGLAITKRLIDKIGGNISVESEIGKGCRFIITLENIPYSDEPQETTHESRENIIQSAENLDVLIVDDILINLKVLNSMLKQLKITCRSAMSGKEALEQIDQKIPDIILTDMWMPEMNGDELALRIRKDERCKNVKVIAVTADSETKSGESADRFDEILLKPITLDKLRKVFV